MHTLHNKLIKVSFILTTLLLLSCCTISSHPISSKPIKKRKDINKSFVKIKKFMIIRECMPFIGECEKGKVYYSSGSGVVIYSSEKGSVILTAGHVCDSMETFSSLSSRSYIKKIDKQIELENIKGKKFKASIIHVELNKKVDLCSLYCSSMKNHPYSTVSRKPPTVGDKIYNVAAPAGIFHPPAVPILTGVFSGTTKNSFHGDMYTVPAVGGSSGSPLYNEKFELVGIIYAASKSFPNLSWASTYKDTISFIKDSVGILRENKFNKKTNKVENKSFKYQLKVIYK